jgi:hypothetical protein
MSHMRWKYDLAAAASSLSKGNQNVRWEQQTKRQRDSLKYNTMTFIAFLL